MCRRLSATSKFCVIYFVIQCNFETNVYIHVYIYAHPICRLTFNKLNQLDSKGFTRVPCWLAAVLAMSCTASEVTIFLKNINFLQPFQTAGCHRRSFTAVPCKKHLKPQFLDQIENLCLKTLLLTLPQQLCQPPPGKSAGEGREETEDLWA